MNFNIRVSWPAWLWINSLADILISIFSKNWYDLITDIEYESRIKWWVNYYDINISDTKSLFLTKKVDSLLVFNNESFEKNIDFLKDYSTVFFNSKLEKFFKEDLKNKIDNKKLKIISIDIDDKYDNTYLLWAFCKYFWIDDNIVIESLKEVFEKKWDDILNKNLTIFNNTFLGIKSEINFTKINAKKENIYWNKAIAYWAIDCWLEYYSAYPMTPASSILTEIINSKKINYLQAEDEISVINSALWASFTWARSMVWTSWWWFALMTEALSFAIQAEIPVVVVLSQRAWPSTWTPTYHETWDLNYALNPTFWDFEHIVLCPSSLEESYFFWWYSLNLADKYQIPVILLTDKQASEMVWTISKLNKCEINRWKILKNPDSNYKRYDLSWDDWISPRVIVWTPNWDFIATSYEHDEYGATTEDSNMKKLMTEKRWKKLKNFFIKENIYWFEVINEKAKKMFILFSYNSYTAKEFVKNNPDYGIIIIKFLKPFDDRIIEIIKDKEEIIFIENNYSWQLENYITKELWLKHISSLKISNMRKYDLFPFYIEDFNNIK